jgi:internalin A
LRASGRGSYAWVSVPCPNPKPRTGLFIIDKLIKARRENQPNYPCPKCDVWTNIDSLLARSVPVQDGPPVLARLDDISKKLKEIHTDVKINYSQADEMFAALMAVLNDEGRDGPRLYSLTLIKPGLLGKPGWISQRFRITLWCEHSRMPVPELWGEPGRGMYEFEKPQEWLIKIAPYAKVIASALFVFLPFAAELLKLAPEDAIYQGLKDNLDVARRDMDELIMAGDIADTWEPE